MAFTLLSIFDGYQAVAPSGWGTPSNELPVDLVPDESGAMTEGTMHVPMVAEDGLGLVFPFICTGWEISPPTLYITDAFSSSGLSGELNIRCAPSSAVHYCTQPTESFSETLNLTNDFYDARYGGTHYLTIADPCTITVFSYRRAGAGDSSVEKPFSFGSPYDPVRAEGARTTLILHDNAGDQPTITWATDADYVSWENGAPQFTSGKTRMVVETVGRYGRIYGWFHLFA